MPKPSKELVSQLLPNTFPFPNVIMDGQETLDGMNIWSLLEPPEQALLPIVYRKTYGWWKKVDRISLLQLADASGYNVDTVRKYMTSLSMSGLVLLVSSGSVSGEANEWSPEIDDAKINFTYLLQRKADKQKKAKRKMKKVRAQRKGIVSHKTPLVAQDATPLVAQDATPLVAQGTQKPETKKTNKRANMPLEWKLAHGDEITQEDIDAETVKTNALQDFERCLGFGTLPWHSNTVWTKFAAFVVKVYENNADTWQEYKVWRDGEGKYSAYSNRKIRESPAAFMDTGYPEFDASRKPKTPEPDWYPKSV